MLTAPGLKETCEGTITVDNGGGRKNNDFH